MVIFLHGEEYGRTRGSTRICLKGERRRKGEWKIRREEIRINGRKKKRQK